MSDRTRIQEALATSDAAWRWFLLGLESGRAEGHAAGYADAMAVLNEAGAFLAAMKPSAMPDPVAVRRRREYADSPSWHTGTSEPWDLTPQPVTPWCACAHPDKHGPYQPGVACAPKAAWADRWRDLHARAQGDQERAA